jgi:hypothetical protein
MGNIHRFSGVSVQVAGIDIYLIMLIKLIELVGWIGPVIQID